MELAFILQSEGIGWDRSLKDWKDQEPKNKWNFLTHVVNLAMVLESRASMLRFTGKDPDTFAINDFEKSLTNECRILRMILTQAVAFNYRIEECSWHRPFMMWRSSLR